MFQTVRELQDAIKGLNPEDFYVQHIFNKGSPYFEQKQIGYFCELFQNRFDIELPVNDVVVVGSAKIGYALHRKKKGDEIYKAFRPYNENSDVDVSVCNGPLFRKIWHELNSYACFQSVMPWNPNGLAEYLMYGWLRPDKFPKGKSLTHCDRFYQTVGRFRRDRARGQPRTTVALFYSEEHLRQYQARGIRLCKQKLENEL